MSSDCRFVPSHLFFQAGAKDRVWVLAPNWPSQLQIQQGLDSSLSSAFHHSTRTGRDSWERGPSLAGQEVPEGSNSRSWCHYREDREHRSEEHFQAFDHLHTATGELGGRQHLECGLWRHQELSCLGSSYALIGFDGRSWQTEADSSSRVSYCCWQHF